MCRGRKIPISTIIRSNNIFSKQRIFFLITHNSSKSWQETAWNWCYDINLVVIWTSIFIPKAKMMFGNHLWFSTVEPEIVILITNSHNDIHMLHIMIILRRWNFKIPNLHMYLALEVASRRCLFPWFCVFLFSSMCAYMQYNFFL